MNGYIARLVRCGVSLEKAENTYRDYMKNFSLGELEVYVRYLEQQKNVDRMEPEPSRA